MGTNDRQLCEAERIEIFRLRAEGKSLREIGAVLGRSASTISRELKRNIAPGSPYDVPLAAERLVQARRRQKKGCKISRLSWLGEKIRDLLAMDLSPEQIAGRLTMEQGSKCISHESIYRFIYSPEGQKAKLHRYLCRRKLKRGHRGRVDWLPIPDRTSIHPRPADVLTRAIAGHWEGDLMLLPKAKQAVVVLTERKTRFMLSCVQEGKKADETRESIAWLMANVPEELKKSMTFDNGGECARHNSLGMETYFCNPHAPWQKGGVENAIGRLRADLPRSTRSNDYSEQDFYNIIDTYNNTPRKCLGYKTPAEEFLDELNKSVALDL